MTGMSIYRKGAIKRIRLKKLKEACGYRSIEKAARAFARENSKLEMRRPQ